MADTIKDKIDEVAKAGVKSVADETGQVQRLSIEEMIKADQYVAAKTAAGRSHFGLRMTKLVPPGTG